MIQIETNINPLNSPLLATAIHNGHYIRQSIIKYLEIDEYTRLREEDPYTEVFTNVSDSYIIINTSRFEVDFNRPPDKAIYKSPDQAWGLKVWKEHVPEYVWEYSIREHEFFYRFLKNTIERFINEWGFIIIYDIHSYNHRRNGPEVEAANPYENPDVNIGTASMNRELWKDLVLQFTNIFESIKVNNRNLIIGENIKFKGGYLANWVHTHYPQNACVLSIEFKKIFMDEWTGAVDIHLIRELRDALKQTILPVLNTAILIKGKQLN